MSFIAAAVIGGVGAIAGGMISANAAKNAAKTQAEAANQATQLQRDQFDRAAQLNEPWRQAGIGALNKLTTASDYTPFGMDQFQADPGYAFRMSEGQKALERSAAARGMQFSGQMIKGTQKYAQDLASNEYTNAFNRYQTERAARLQPLQALAGIGQSATNQVTNAGQNYATNAGDMMTSGAAARASGYVGGANALNSALGSAGNSYMSGQMLNRLMPSPTASTYAGPNYYGTPGYTYDPVGLY
jgi:hypothetical protein